MKYLITGTPHSGTRYMAFLFRAFDIDIGHETLGKDGTSCWAWGAPNADKVPPPWSPGLRPDLEGWEVIHIYRDPLKCIPALAQDTNQKSLGLLAQQLDFPEDLPPLRRATMTYFGWNLLIQQFLHPDHTINVEEAEDWAKQHLGQNWLPLPPKNTNSRALQGKRTPTTWSEIDTAAPECLDALQALAEERGYIGV